MSTKITRLPVGLQDFLGTQAFGKNPDELAQVVAPTIDLGTFLSVNKEKWLVKGFTSFTGSSTFVSTTVPEGLVYVLLGIGVRHNIQVAGSAGSYTMNYVMSNNSNSNGPLNEHPIAAPFEFVLPAGDGQRIYSWENLPSLIAVPGTQITWIATDVKSTGTTFNPIGYIRYLELSV